MIFFKTIYVTFTFFYMVYFIFDLNCLNSFYNLQILVFFLWHTFLWLFLFLSSPLLSAKYLFPDTEPPIIRILYEWSKICGQFDLCSFMCSFVTPWKLIIFVWFYYIVIFNFFFFPYLILTRSICICFYRINSLHSLSDCNLLSSFELKAILLISSVKTLCFSLLNLYCVFNINLLL